MRSLEENQARWLVTQSHSASLVELGHAVKSNVLSSPCLSGCRSVCWKIFLLTADDSTTSWIRALEEGRSSYQERREHHLKYIQHPEALAELSVDPLTDDPESPWNAVRRDEIMRAEIQQDVERLPDEVNYHEQAIQGMILDILFIYCKTFPDKGGYRQGMHELLAPIVHVVEQDAIDRGAISDDAQLDQAMVHVMDAAFVEHDAYVLFAQVMEHAQSFFKMNQGSLPSHQVDAPDLPKEPQAAIVDRSRYIHEVCLHKVDPELAAHLSDIEILPQIFLIRWLRLLFSREFPLDHLLVLWDNIFIVDPSLSLVDLICVAMLIRIRWQLLEADYSVCLQLLLKYPQPEQPHGPHTFIDDAIYLRDEMNSQRGSSLVSKYTGRTPRDPSVLKSRVSGILDQADGSSPPPEDLDKSPMSFNPSFRPQQASVEAILQSAAKRANRVFEKGEQLGFNQAVREAMGEIRRNVQSFNEARQAHQSPRGSPSDEGATKALAAIERRNRQLASLLSQSVTNLKQASASQSEDKNKSLELIELAAAKIQFVQIYLEDSTMDVPALPPPMADAASRLVVATADELDVSEASAEKPIKDGEQTGGQAETPEQRQTTPPDTPKVPVQQTSEEEGQNEGSDASKANAMADAPAPQAEPQGIERVSARRPAAVPTRSSLAQSSFSWMLEPDEASPAAPGITGPKSPPPTRHKKRASSNMSRERSAFLFGEGPADVAGGSVMPPDDIFGMEPISKAKAKAHSTLFDEP